MKGNSLSPVLGNNAVSYSTSIFSSRNRFLFLRLQGQQNFHVAVASTKVGNLHSFTELLLGLLNKL